MKRVNGIRKVNTKGIKRGRLQRRRRRSGAAKKMKERDLIIQDSVKTNELLKTVDSFTNQLMIKWLTLFGTFRRRVAALI